MKKAFISFAIVMAVGVSGVYSQKKSNSPAPVGDGSMFIITIDHNGQKTDLKNTQFEDYTGQAFTNDSVHGKMTLESRAANEKSNDENFAFTGSIITDAKGVYTLGGGDGTNFTFQTTKFPWITTFVCRGGAYDISAMPLKGGFVEGTFTTNCEAISADQSQLDHYTLSGSFKLLRMR